MYASCGSVCISLYIFSISISFAFLSKTGISTCATRSFEKFVIVSFNSFVSVSSSNSIPSFPLVITSSDSSMLYEYSCTTPGNSTAVSVNILFKFSLL